MGENNFFEFHLGKTGDILNKISRINVQSLLSGNSEKIYSDREETILSLKNCTLYLIPPDIEGYEPRIRLRLKTSEKDVSHQFCSINSVSLAPIWDEEFLYCRGHLLEATASLTDRSIPSRDYALFSYPYKNLLAISDIENLVNKELLIDAPQHENEETIFVEIFLFSLLKDSGKTIKKHISLQDFRLLFKSNKFLNFCNDEGFDYVAYKLINGAKKLSLSLNKQIESSRLKSLKEGKEKTFVIFVDSLDKTIANSEIALAKLPHLKNLVDNSILFSNYTASGFWTFPCLHAIHHGIAPYLSGSFMRIIPQKLFNHAIYSNSNTFVDVYQRLANQLYNSISLTKFLKSQNYACAAIKATTQTNAFWKLLDGTDVSIEAASCELVAAHLKNLLQLYGDFISCYFIDIDPLHQNPTNLTYDLNTDWGGLPRLDWLNKSQSKKNRLLGIQDSSVDEELREDCHLRRLDRLLGDLSELFGHDSNIILYSDNGSQVYKNRSTELNFSLKNSSATPEKLFQPTLLVHSPKLGITSQGISNSLVTSCDLFAIISKTVGVSNNTLSELSCKIQGFDSIVPKELGGHKNRKRSISFGLNVKDNLLLECVIRDKNQVLFADQREAQSPIYDPSFYIDKIFNEIKEEI